MNMKLDDKEILQALLITCHRRDSETLSRVIQTHGLSRIKAVCIAHGIAHYLIDLIDDSFHSLPENVTALLAKPSEYCLQLKIQNGFQEQYIQLVLKELEKKDIDFIPLKGRALQRFLYKMQEYKPAADVDILIKPCSRVRVLQIFSNQDFYNPRHWEPKVIINQFSQRKVIAPSVKVDFDIHLKTSNNPIINELFTVEEAFKNRKYSRLTPPYLLFHAVLQMIGHNHYNDPIKAVWLLDIALLTELLNENDWQLFKEQAINKNCTHLVVAAFEEINRLFPTQRISLYLKEMKDLDILPTGKVSFLLSSPSRAKIFFFIYLEFVALNKKYIFSKKPSFQIL